MPTVFHFKTLDVESGEWRVQPSKRTSEAILAIGGRIVAGSGQYVAPTSLSADGLYLLEEPYNPEVSQE